MGPNKLGVSHNWPWLIRIQCPPPHLFISSSLEFNLYLIHIHNYYIDTENLVGAVNGRCAAVMTICLLYMQALAFWWPEGNTWKKKSMFILVCCAMLFLHLAILIIILFFQPLFTELSAPNSPSSSCEFSYLPNFSAHILFTCTCIGLFGINMFIRFCPWKRKNWVVKKSLLSEIGGAINKPLVCSIFLFFFKEIKTDRQICKP